MVRYLTAREKLLSLARINKTWNSLISKHYSWIRFPERGPRCLVSDFIDFFDRVPSLSQMDVTDFPADFLSVNRIESLGSARSVGITANHSSQLLKITQSPLLLQKLISLTVDF